MKIIITEEQKKKLFIPRRQSGEDSKWNEWNKEQPVKDGIRINQYTDDGLKTGYWEDYYDNENIESKGFYKDDEREGIWEEYYYGGNLYSKGLYDNGKRDGIWEYYHRNGIIESKGLYKDGEREGIWEFYWENGNITGKGNYVNGNIDGLWVGYHENGGIDYKGSFKNGLMEGIWEYYHENGNIHSKGLNLDGKREGYWEFYDSETGESTHKILFNKGKIIGRWNTSKQSLDETIKASEAYSDINSFKTVESGKRGIAWIQINLVNKDIKKYILNSIKKNDFGYIVVKEHPNKPIIVYRDGYRKNAEELAKIASKYNGYLSGRATYEDSKRIGELLEYDPNDINDYLNKNYVNGVLKEGKVYPYNLNVNESDDDYVLYEFKNKDGFDFEVEFYKYNDFWEREYKTFQKGMGTLNTNDVYNIIETVTNITIDFIKKYQPKEVKIIHIRQNKESIFTDPDKPTKRALLNQRYLRPAIDKLPNYTYVLKGSKSIISKI